MSEHEQLLNLLQRQGRPLQIKMVLQMLHWNQEQFKKIAEQLVAEQVIVLTRTTGCGCKTAPFVINGEHVTHIGLP